MGIKRPGKLRYHGGLVTCWGFYRWSSTRSSDEHHGRRSPDLQAESGNFLEARDILSTCKGMGRMQKVVRW